MTATIFAVSIGRNLGTAPMSDQRWREFQHAARRAVARSSGAVLAHTTGRGAYLDDPEDCAIILGQADPAALPDLRHRLRRIAQRYGQDSIGLLVHGSNRSALIYANERTPSHAAT